MRWDSRNGGAVHILFLVVVLLVALAFGALWFVQVQENEALVNSADRYKKAAELTNLKLTFALDSYAVVAKLAGAGLPQTLVMPDDADLVDTTVDQQFEPQVQAIKGQLRALGGEIDDPTASPTTLREAWDPIKSALTSAQTQIRQKENEIASLKAQITNKDQQIGDAQRTAEGERNTARDEHTAFVTRANSQLGELRDQNDAFSSRNREIQDEVDRVKDESNRERQRLVSRTQELQGQVRSIKDQLKIEKERETPDGKVLSSDPRSGMVFVDIGGQQQLRRGTRFKVYETGKGDTKIHKGWVVVTAVSPLMSEARIESQTSGTGGITAGDWLYNPYFQTDRQTSFAFLGQLTGRYSREQAERILKSFGARIDEKAGINTDFLVLGVKEDPDAEDLTETEDYKAATTYGVEIIGAKELVDFLTF